MLKVYKKSLYHKHYIKLNITLNDQCTWGQGEIIPFRQTVNLLLKVSPKSTS